MLKKLQSAVVVPAVLFAGSAMAAVPTEIITAIDTAGDDMATVAGAVFVAIIALLGFKLMRRAAK